MTIGAEITNASRAERDVRQGVDAASPGEEAKDAFGSLDVATRDRIEPL